MRPRIVQGHETEDAILGGCDAYCVCNWFGCNCDGCENAYPVTDVNYKRKPGPGSCGWEDGGCEKYGGYMGYNDIGCDDDDPGVICDRQSPTCYGDRIEDDRRQLMDAKEKKDDGCGDFHYFRSLSADGKRKSLATKYCGGEDQVVREDIYTILLHEVLLQFNGISPSDVVSYIKTAGGIDQVLTCDLFNKAYGDLDHLTLCENKHLDSVPANTKKGKKQKKTP